MAVQTDGPEITLYASGDLSALQFHIITVDTDGYAKQADDADDPAEPMVGVLQNKPDAAGEEAVIRIGGTAKVMCGESLNEGTWVTTDSSGHAVAAVANDNVLGCMLSSGANGSLGVVLLAQGSGHVVPA